MNEKKSQCGITVPLNNEFRVGWFDYETNLALISL